MEQLNQNNVGLSSQIDNQNSQEQCNIKPTIYQIYDEQIKKQLQETCIQDQNIQSQARQKIYPNKRNIKNFNKFNSGSFTHFINIPMNTKQNIQAFGSLQQKILDSLSEEQRQFINLSNPNYYHMTISMLVLANQSSKDEAIIFFRNEIQAKIQEFMRSIKKDCITFSFKGLQVFNIHAKKDCVLYAEIDEKCDDFVHLQKITDIIIRSLVMKEIVHPDDLKAMNVFYDSMKGQFAVEKYHVTLMRIKNCKQQSVLMAKDLLAKYANIEDIGELNINQINLSTRFKSEQHLHEQSEKLFFSQEQQINGSLIKQQKL